MNVPMTETAKQKVLARHPNAVPDKDGYIDSYGFFDCAIFPHADSDKVLGSGETLRQAWAYAARKLPKKRKSK